MSPDTTNTLAFGVHLLTRFQCDPPTEEQTLEEYTAETLAFTLELHKDFKGKGQAPQTPQGSVCQGRTKKGAPCKRAGSNDGYCKAHIPEGVDPLPNPDVETPPVAPLVVPDPEPEIEESQTLTPAPEPEIEPEPAQVPIEDEIRAAAAAKPNKSKKTKCAGQGKKGPCKSSAMKNSEFCKRHEGAPPLPNPVAANPVTENPAVESPVWTQCEADGCTETAEDDSEFCETHGSEITEPIVAATPAPKPKSKTIMPEESEEDILASILEEL